jgi:alkaline phosphatase
LVLSCAVFLLVLALRPAADAEGQDATRVILFVVDGAGVGHWSLANLSSAELALRQFPVVGLVDTRGADHIYTGSAATATAYAIGERTFRNAIGVGVDSLPRKTVLELAEERGMSTGLVTTGRITDATPAAFATHLSSRRYEWEIARRLTTKNITVLMGGGRDSFEAWDRPDSIDLVSTIKESYTFAETDADLQGLEMDTVTNLFGLFTPSDMPVYPERSPSLRAMTAAALEVLDKNSNGFFLLLETEQTDTQAHGNAGFEVLADELTDVDNAIRVVLEYQSRHPETLFIVLGDHDTGGLAVQTAGVANLLARTVSGLDTMRTRLSEASPLLDGAGRARADSIRVLMDRVSPQIRQRFSEAGSAAILVARYTSVNHTAQLVPLFAKGPGADQFGGIIDNWMVGQLLLAAVQSSEAVASRRIATIYGRVLDDSSSIPIAGAEVTLLDRAGNPITAVVSGLDGRFVLAVRPGVFVIQVLRIGYARTLTEEFTLPESLVPHRVNVLLPSQPVVLEEVVVTGVAEPSSPGRLEGFYERKRQGWGLFLTQEDIGVMTSIDFTDILNGLPGGPPSKACPPSLYVDGVRYPPDEDFNLSGILASEVDAVEVYRRASETPVHFLDGNSLCGAIVVWTIRYTRIEP